MSLPDRIRNVLPADTAMVWELLAPIIPDIVHGLGYFGDVEPDDSLPVSRPTIVDYWTGRHPDVIAAMGRTSP